FTAVAGYARLRQTLVDHRLVQRGRLDTGRRIERRLAVLADHVAAVGPQRVVIIDVGFDFLALQTEARNALRLQFFRRVDHVVPGLRAVGIADLREQVLVVVQRARGSGD